MTKFDEVKQFVEFMKSSGVSAFEVGDIKVTFDVLQSHQAATPSHLPSTPEAREEALTKIKEELKSISASADQDMFWSV